MIVFLVQTKQGEQRIEVTGADSDDAVTSESARRIRAVLEEMHGKGAVRLADAEAETRYMRQRDAEGMAGLRFVAEFAGILVAFFGIHQVTGSPLVAALGPPFILAWVGWRVMFSGRRNAGQVDARVGNEH